MKGSDLLMCFFSAAVTGTRNRRTSAPGAAKQGRDRCCARAARSLSLASAPSSHSGASLSVDASPPDGPPWGTNFSLRNAMHPLPPSPACTVTSHSSTNFMGHQHGGAARWVRAMVYFLGTGGRSGNGVGAAPTADCMV